MPESKTNIGLDELAGSAMERSRLYGLLANVFRREPSVEFLCHLRTPELIVALGAAEVDLGDAFRTRKFVDIAGDLAIEYTRLFLGPGRHISPHESVQLKRGSGILWGPETSTVRQSYRAAGFEIGDTETDIPDHISIELDFLALLTKREAETWQKEDQEQTLKILQFEHDFISRHLGKWVAGFSAKVKDQADFDFYPAFVELLNGYLSGEKSEIASRLRLIGDGEQTGFGHSLAS